VAEILWTSFQETHITARHGVTAKQFDEAWHDRIDVAAARHRRHGPYYLSVGLTDGGRVVEMVWRWQHGLKELDLVWPVTACFVENGE
jgi:hypothetical protein